VRLRVSFYTLGCKLNQLETESIAGAFVRFGAEVGSFGDESSDTMDEPEKAGGEARACPSDLVVINTCTVTSKAEQKARRIIRLVATGQPDVAVIITGCYAQVDAAAWPLWGEHRQYRGGEGRHSRPPPLA
jgi:threonylcarbamoyladenosine tRNA methylthiotransferase MtaB